MASVDEAIDALQPRQSKSRDYFDDAVNLLQPAGSESSIDQAIDFAAGPGTGGQALPIAPQPVAPPAVPEQQGGSFLSSLAGMASKAVQTAASPFKVSSIPTSIDQAIDALQPGASVMKSPMAQRIAGDVGAGIVGTAEGINAIVPVMIGPDNRVAKSFTKSAEWWRDVSREMTPADANIVDEVVQGAASTLPYYVAGVGVAGGVAGARMLGTVAARLAPYLGSAVSGVLEASQNAGQQFMDLREQGMDDKEAVKRADALFWGNMLWNTVMNKAGGLFDSEKAGILMSAIRAAAPEGLQEWGQEVMSQFTGQKDGKPFDIVEAMKSSEALKALGLGSLIGGLFGGGGAAVQRASGAAPAAAAPAEAIPAAPATPVDKAIDAVVAPAPVVEGKTTGAQKPEDVESQARAAVEEAGAAWVGIQKTRQPGKEAMVLFNHPSGSTLQVPISQANAEAVRARMQAWDQEASAAQGKQEGTAPAAPPASSAPSGQGLPQVSGGPQSQAGPGPISGPPLQTGPQAAEEVARDAAQVALPVHPFLQGQKSVFRPAVPFAESIARQPEFIKFFSDSDAIVRRYAEKMGRELTPEFARTIGSEIHDDENRILRAANKEERLRAIADFKAKYKWQSSEETAFDVARLKAIGQVITNQESLAKTPALRAAFEDFLRKKMQYHGKEDAPKWLSEKLIAPAPSGGYTGSDAPVQAQSQPASGGDLPGPGGPAGPVLAGPAPAAVEPGSGGVPPDAAAGPLRQNVEPAAEPAAKRVRLKSTGPRTYSILEELPAEPGDLPGEKFYRIKDEKTGEVQVVESGDLLPVKVRPKGMGKEIESPEAMDQGLQERAARGEGGFLDKEPPTPAGPPTDTPAAKATEGLPPAIEMPEIVEIAHGLLGGKYPKIIERMRSAGVRGFFSPGKGEIALSANIFKDASGAARTLAHEIGHLVDWLPQQDMGRGNILGRIGSLRKYMSEMIEAMPDQAGKVLSATEREKIRSQLVADLVRKSGGTMQKFIQDQAFRKQIASQIPELYKRRIEAEVAKRGLITKAQVTAELKKLTMLWKPFDENANANFTAYRYSSPELYADAISVLFNNPALLKQTAPSFYKGWFNYLERKPEVRKAYHEITDRVNSGDVAEGRQSRVAEMFEAGERQAVAERLATQEKPRDIVSGLRREFIDKNEGILAYIRRAKQEGRAIRPEDNPQYWLEEMNYSASEVKSWLQGYNEVLDALKKADLEWEDLGEVLFHQRVVGERSDKANPLGFTPETSAAQLEFMRKQMGEEKWAELMRQTDKFRESWKFIVDKLEESDMLSPELMKKIRENPYYVTFDVFSKHADEMSGGGSGAGAKIYGQVGTLQEISNPATASLMKGVALIKAINRNSAAKATTDFLEKNFGGEAIRPAEEKWNGFTRAPREPASRDKGLITYMDGGRLKGFVVDSEVAKAFERDAGSFNPIINALRLSQGFFRNVFVQKNPGFMAFNMWRDFFRAYKNLPKATLGDVARHYTKALDASFRRGFNIPDNLVREMLEKKMLITMEEKWGISTEDEQVRALMDRYFTGKSEGGNKIISGLKRLGAFLDNIGSAIEAMPKLAGYQYLKEHQKELNLSDQEVAHMIRGQVGSPDFLRRGGSYGLYNNVFMFSNSIKEGWRADLEAMRDRPGEYAMKTAKLNLVPKMLMFAATVGLMGGGLKEIMDRVSEYDKTNYNIIPLGLTANGKAVYIRVPQDEAGRFLAGLFWKMMNKDREKSMTDLADYMAGQAPTLTPSISLAADVLQYLSGKNPYDYFRQRNAVPEQVFEAGGMRSHLAFLRYLANQGGAGVIHRFPTDDVDKAETVVEKILGAPIIGNILGRFIKISNYGKYEELQRVVSEVRRKEANKKLDERDAIVANINAADKPGAQEAAHLYAEMVKGGMLRRKEGTSVVPFNRFLDGYQRFAARRTADPFINALIFARSNEEKTALLKHYRQTMKKDEFDKVVASATAGGHLTGEPLTLSFIEGDDK